MVSFGVAGRGGKLPNAATEGVDQLLRRDRGCRIAEKRQQKRDVVVAQLNLRRHMLLNRLSITESVRLSNLPMITEYTVGGQTRYLSSGWQQRPGVWIGHHYATRIRL
ncbi:MAG: hypothetical protein QOF33_3340 [Thermomicrobiales bacterium]|jgi:hypothetical protein|nr:hypothetical protein [Thermomicrobiales bacterium]